jgi:hypothetical protein
MEFSEVPATDAREVAFPDVRRSRQDSVVDSTRPGLDLAKRTPPIMDYRREPFETLGT